ncbi:MAG: hypothetical protein M1820_009435 [Bogoriella megaspora]|nr:MAG: hypothetical protein M1820_009435 [Bogoriella megaspora]
MSTNPSETDLPPIHLTETDKLVLSQTDEEFLHHTWDELEVIIAENRLETLKRKPSDTRKYLAWITRIISEYGNTTNYVLQKRLPWTPLPPSSTVPTVDQAPTFAFKNSHPFADPDDYLILKNDWPYGVQQGIIHLLVWLKTPISVQPDTGEITEEGKEIVEDWVGRTFVERLVKEGGDKGESLSRKEAGARVLWFKNWTKLQSVRGLDHVHIFLRDIPQRLQTEWMQ